MNQWLATGLGLMLLCCTQQSAVMAQSSGRAVPNASLWADESELADQWVERSSGFSNFADSGDEDTTPSRPAASSRVKPVSYDYEYVPITRPASDDSDFHWQFAPTGLLYKAYLAGVKESRISSVWLSDSKRGLMWENALGGRVGLVRYGNEDVLRPQGWQFDLEGAALPRVIPQEPSSPLEAVDFRVGLLSTWRSGDTAIKAGYYHLSAHIGDEYLIANPTFDRINYVRDALIFGVTQYLYDDFSVYAEIAYALNHEDGAEPLEFQYGVQYSPLVTGWPGAPFAAVNGHTREDYNWATSLTVQAGWQWRSAKTSHTLRVGMQYYTGPSMQWELGDVKENMLGGGIWFDF